MRAKRELAETALARIIERTPVGTGHARANWQVSLNRPATGTVSGTDAGGAATLARGAAVIARDRDPFSTVWITNNVPYIQELEQGTATQPPAGMVARTVAELSRK